jgi:hypothetical protein
VDTSHVEYQKFFESLFEKTSCEVSGLKGEAEGYITVSNSQSTLQGDEPPTFHEA